MSLAAEVVRRQHNDRLGWTDEDRLERDEVAEEQSLDLADRWATSRDPGSGIPLRCSAPS